MIDSLLSRRLGAFITDWAIVLFIIIFVSGEKQELFNDPLAYNASSAVFVMLFHAFWILFDGRSLGMRLFSLNFVKIKKRSNLMLLFFLFPHASIVFSFMLNWLSLYLEDPRTTIVWFKVGYYESSFILLEYSKTALTIFYLTMLIPSLLFARKTGWEIISGFVVTNSPSNVIVR